MGHGRASAAGLGQGPAVPGQGARPGRRGRPTSSGCSGSAARGRTRTARRRRRAPSPSCSTPPGSPSRCSATARPARATPARRAGNEFLFQTLAAQNVGTFGEFGVTKVVVTCAHCFNTIKNEYPQIGGNYEVVHHTQLLNRLVRDKRLRPVARPADVPGMSSARNPRGRRETVTYHDPCYLGRHNDVYAPPRELIGALPGVELREMPRTREKSFCCGAGGARMWMEEKLGTRINSNRTEEAIATGAERDRHRLPVLPGHDLRRAHRGAGRRVARRRSRSSTSPRCCWPPCVAARLVTARATATRRRRCQRWPALGCRPPRLQRSPHPPRPPPLLLLICWSFGGCTAAVAAPPRVEADPWDEPAPTALRPPVAHARPPRGEPDRWDEPVCCPPRRRQTPGTSPPPRLRAVEADPWDYPRHGRSGCFTW